MRMNLKKVLAGAAGVAMAATLAPVLTATTAGAAGVLQGPATISPSSGGSATAFNLSLPVGAACAEDSAAGDWRTTSFMVPSGTDLTTLTFDPSGPSPAGLGTYASFRQPLWEVGGNPYVSRSTVNATPPDPTGPILPPAPIDFGVYAPGDVPAGAYDIGIACTDETNAIQQYWTTKITVTTNAADPGPADINWAVGATPSAPTITTVTPGDGTLTVAFTAPPATPAVSTYTLSATPVGGGAAITATGAGSPITLTGLTNGTAYNLSLTATNTVGTSAAGIGTGTPAPGVRPAVTGLTATPATGLVDLSWVTPTGPAPTGYTLDISDGTTTNSVTLPAGTTTYQATGLTAGTSYTFTVTPLHPAPYVASAASVTATPLAAQVLLQDITVTRPVGALVLTQVCGAYGSLAAEGAQLGFPSGLTAAPAVNSSTVAAPTAGGTAPTTGAAPGGPADTVRNQYPYPTNPDGTANATYPTHCGINLGNAQFVRSGAGAGQFFAADGRLNQVTVVDTRDGDLGWNVVGQVSNFTAGPGKTFSGSQLGWVPVKTEDTSPFTDSLGNTYDQVATAGSAIAPNTAVASGLSSNRTLITANPFAGTAANGTGGLGTAIADARLKLLIPVTAQSGVYSAVLTISTL